jgi:Protein of unknown function (DUF2911)
MKRSSIFSFIVLTSILSISAFAQDGKPLSPPAVAEGVIDGVNVNINYSAPSSRGRKMLGGNDAFGTVWRTGANASTSIEFSAPVKIEGKPLAAGKYALFTIPGETEWTIIINKTIAMGAFSYQESEDLLRVKVKSAKPAAFVETLNISIVKNQVVLKWENTQVAFTVSK